MITKRTKIMNQERTKSKLIEIFLIVPNVIHSNRSVSL